MFKIPGICQPLWRTSQRPAANAYGERDGTEGAAILWSLRDLKGIYLGPIVLGWIDDDILMPVVDSHDIRLVNTPTRISEDAGVKNGVNTGTGESEHGLYVPRRFRGLAPT